MHGSGDAIIDAGRTSRDVAGHAAAPAGPTGGGDPRPVGGAAKRTFDVVMALGLIVFLAPLLALIALLIRMDSRGPVFFRQRRGGLGGRPFAIWKFRTMTALEDGEHVVQARPRDARITRIGRVLRRTSLDELPQLFNVVAGDMSLVGPRPHAVAHDRAFAEMAAGYERRFLARPGITGLAQVRGSRGRLDSPAMVEARLVSDLEYVSDWSMLRDVGILIATARLLLFDTRAY